MSKGAVIQLHEKLGGAPLSKQGLRLWLRLLTCTHHIERSVRSRLRTEFSTTLPRFDLLAALDRQPDGATMSELSQYLLVSNGNITGLVARLEVEGLVERTRSKQDRRTSRVRLTERGARAFQEMADVHAGWIDDMLSGLSPSEIDLLLGLLGRLKESLSDAQAKEER